MKTLDELKNKAEAIHIDLDRDDWHTAHARFRDYVTHELVLALFSDRDRANQSCYYLGRERDQIKAENDILKSHADEMTKMRNAHGYESWAKVLVECISLKDSKHTIECRFEVSEDTLATIRQCLSEAEGDIDNLKEENESLRKDANRYRWMLVNIDLMHWENMLRYEFLEGEKNISQVIDDAIQSEGPKGQP